MIGIELKENKLFQVYKETTFHDNILNNNKNNNNNSISKSNTISTSNNSTNNNNKDNNNSNKELQTTSTSSLATVITSLSPKLKDRIIILSLAIGSDCNGLLDQIAGFLKEG